MGSNVVYGTTLLGVAIVGGYAYDGFWDAIWKAKNRGVSEPRDELSAIPPPAATLGRERALLTRALTPPRRNSSTT